MEKSLDAICVGLVNVNLPVRPVDKGVFDTDLTPVGPIELLLGGDAVNEAVTLAALGNRTAISGKIGDDVFGRVFLDLASKTGVDMRSVKKSAAASTSVCVMLINQDGRRNFASYRGANTEFCLSDVDLDRVSTARLVSIGASLP